ncbi:hypothetical protein [Streptomyces sp. NPDC093261]|uniref:hypothetical protein n=1 Tax=Streptomyces sp. NPDC093261 TaxID=3366037 RepID=UPI0037F38B40
MGLADRIGPPEHPDARRERHPHGFDPGARFVGGEPAEVTLRLDTVPEDEARWRDEIQRVTGLRLPEHRKVELTQVRYWGEPAQPMVYCRFAITDRASTPEAVDTAALLAQLRGGERRPRTAFTGETTLCLSWNDWQVAKSAGGGTAGLAERLDAAFDQAAERARELRRIGRDLGRLVVLGGGDIVEGCTIYPNQAYEIDGDRRAQVRNAVTFALDGLDRLAPLFKDVTVLVVGGNHGENRIAGNRTTRSDNDDCAVFEHAARAAERDRRLSHVRFSIADGELAKTLDVHGWILGTTHGHVFARGSGSAEAKAYRWYSGQAAGHRPAGDCDLLVTHHYHHFAARDWGGCMWIQTPALDGGSDHFTDATGQGADPGMLSWVMSPDKRFADALIL